MILQLIYSEGRNNQRSGNGRRYSLCAIWQDIYHLRSKKDLIDNFIAGIYDVDDVMNEWHSYVAEQREKALVQIITEEKLKESETRAFVAGAFHDGGIKPTGTDIDKILPAVSCFGGGGRNRKAKKPTSKISRNSLNDFET